jgi:hypothetical protein
LTLSNSNFLLVEGKDDQYAIATLMGKYVDWGNSKEKWPVLIKPAGSADELLAETFISLELKASEVKILGIVIDADDDFETRWATIRRECCAAFPDIPEKIDSAGLVMENADQKRLGVWIMPDNSSRGMLETFLAHLVPSDPDGMWKRAQDTVSQVMKDGAPCKACHQDKSTIHTWLAWRDPPGRVFGEAILMNILDAKSTRCEGFVAWFRNLYQI